MTPEYEAWNAALAERFLQERTGEPLYLYTDEAVLEEIAAQVGVAAADALDSFVSAVRGTLGSHEPFAAWSAKSRGHVPAAEAPIWLGVLCFLVLVAVERESTRFQYYPELNAHLRRARDAGAPPGFDPHVPLLFERFNDWLRTAGARHGTPTARSHQHFPHVGWPLSQAIVRPVDRALLVRLFISANLSSGKQHTGSWLRATLVPRLQTAAASPSRSRLLDLNEHHGDLLEDVLLQEYTGWDGSAAAAHGPRRVLLRLCFDEASGDWWLLCPRLEGTERSTWRIGTQTGRVPPFKGLEAVLPDSELWQLVGAGDIGHIQDGPALTSRRAHLRWLSVDTRAGAWAEVSRREPSLPQLVLARAGDVAHLERLAGVKALEDPPPGHQLLLVPAGCDVPEHAPAQGELRPRMEGGLCLSHSTSTYLLAGSDLPVVRPATSARLDGQHLQVEDGAACFRGVDVAPGDHALKVDQHCLSLRVVERLQAGPTSPAAASWLDDLPIVPRLGLPWDEGSIWLLGERGQLEQRPVVPPAWAKEIGLSVTEIDVTSTIRSTWFAPAFVLAEAFQGKPWVVAVPVGLSVAQPNESPRQLNRDAARALVSRLLVGYGPAERHSDARWKRAFAALMRTAHA